MTNSASTTNSQLAALLGLVNLTLFEDLTGLARFHTDLAERIRLDTLAAGLFARFAEQTSELADSVGVLERFASPLQTFLTMTEPAEPVQQDVLLVLLAGAQLDLAAVLEAQGRSVSSLSAAPELWRVVDHGSARVIAELASDQDAISMTSMYARRVLAEFVVLIQTVAARDTELSNELSGFTDDGLADLAGVSRSLEKVVAASSARLRLLGLNV